MPSTLSIIYLSDLYEVSITGTLIRKIVRHSPDGYYKELTFDELPEKVKEEIIQSVLENFK